jgi:NADH-quinone oxidoreductase subunit C
MATISNSIVFEAVNAHFGDAIISAEEPQGFLTIEIHPSIVIDFFTFLHKNEDFKYRFLTDLCGVHYPNQAGKELGVVYHLHSLENNHRIRVKAFIPADAPQIASVQSIFKSANWQERETFDFYGIEFLGHPDLRRILNMDEMTYHPLLKQYTLEDPTRTDKDDKYFGR